MKNPETQTTWGTQDTGQINVKRKLKGQSRMNNPETLSTLSTEDTEQIHVREKRRGNQEWTIRRHCQH